MRDRVDIDYAKKLSAEERSWLASFNEAEYGHNPHYLEDITGEPVTVDEKRRIWREIQRYRRDCLTVTARMDMEFYYLHLESKAQSVEDSLIEMIDRQDELERISIQSLKTLIQTKNWS